MIDLKVFIRATIVGVVMELVLMTAVHFSTYVAHNDFLFGGMIITAVAGYLYGMDAAKGYFASATGGAIVGVVAALVGVGISVAAQDAPQRVIPFFTAICVFTGAIGGLFGQMSANIRRMGRR